MVHMYIGMKGNLSTCRTAHCTYAALSAFSVVFDGTMSRLNAYLGTEQLLNKYATALLPP